VVALLVAAIGLRVRNQLVRGDVFKLYKVALVLILVVIELRGSGARLRREEPTSAVR